MTDTCTETGSASARINLIRCLTAASPADNISSNTWTSTHRVSVMTIFFNLGPSAKINLNGCPEKISHIQIPTPVSPAVYTLDQNVRPAQTPHTSNATSRGNVFIRTSSAMVILSVNQGKMRTCPIQSAVKSILKEGSFNHLHNFAAKASFMKT